MQQQPTYNPEFDPGIEGGVDTNKLPWITVPAVPGMSIKPLRASAESGMFSVIVRLKKGASIPGAVFLGGMDMMVLSGELDYRQDNVGSVLEPGVWGYISANSRVASMTAREDCEYLGNFYGAIALLSGDGAVRTILTSADIRRLARQSRVSLVPDTLAGCMKDRAIAAAAVDEPLAIASKTNRDLLVAAAASDSAHIRHPGFIDTRRVPWAYVEGLPDIGLKILRISEETQVVSLITRHNAVAPPHTHIGAGDFLILSGRIGYRAGPPEGYGPGVWFYEPAGARHDATQRLTDEDLIYTANIYGAVVFDSGRGTKPTAVLSWIEYKELAKAAGVTLVPSTDENDSTLLAGAPLELA